MEQHIAHATISNSSSLPLNSQYFSRLATTFNRIFAAIYTAAILALFYYHINFSFLQPPTSLSSLLIFLSLFISDIVLAVYWITTQCTRMITIYRREFLGNLKQLLKKDSHFPALDVFICTADPYKEPPMSVLNAALSVLAYDYPTSKLSVYVSDDGGSAMTLFAFMEGAKFAAEWLPFCKRNGVLERNPNAFFASNQDMVNEKIKIMYEKMKMRVENVMEKGKVGDEFINGEEDSLLFHKWTKSFTSKNHPTIIKVLLDNSKSKDINGESLPNLVYVSRQKSPTSHSHFKAGALNTLLRVSATMTNAPIILSLDCDTYSNDPQTPKRALCYFLDPKISSNCSFVQFPQRFQGISKNDIYAGEYLRVFQFNPIGMDGLLGPLFLGTGCFFNRRAFFGGLSSFESPKLVELNPNHIVKKSIQSQEVLDLAHVVARCDYENNTKWGLELGFTYGSLAEDYFTSYLQKTRGWKSIFCNPQRAAFLGEAPMNLIDVITQVKRWVVGNLEVGFSKYNPIIYGMRSLGVLMSLMFYQKVVSTFLSFPVTVYAFLPPLALINGVSIFPKVTDPFFVLYVFLFLGAYGQDLLEFKLEGCTFRKWWNDQRIWNIKPLSSNIFGFIEFSLKTFFGISTGVFNVTSKAINHEQCKRYRQEMFDFGTPSLVFIPMTTAAIINFVAGLIGIWRSLDRGWEQLFLQMLLAGFVVVNCWPLYEAMVFRNDGGKLPPKITFLSLFLALFLCCFSVFLF